MYSYKDFLQEVSFRGSDIWNVTHSNPPLKLHVNYFFQNSHYGSEPGSNPFELNGDR